MPFETSQGPKTAYVTVESVTSDECPVSLLTRNPADQSRDLVNIFNQVEPIKELHPMGNASKWPSSFLDAFVILSAEKNKHDYAQQIAARKAQS